MEKIKNGTVEKITLTFEHNPYVVEIFNPKKASGTTILFPIFHYQTSKQYVHLINELVDRGHRLIALNLLNRGDRVLFFNYYYTVFSALIEELHTMKIIGSKKDDDLIAMGVGIGANLASYCNYLTITGVTISKVILISPVNRYKAEYRISAEIAHFKIPTYIYYGQFDKVTDVNTRYSIFQSGKDNPNVHFTCYPATGHYLYYRGPLSMELEKLYRNSGFDLMIGETKKNKIPFLPSEPELNESFFRHVGHVIEGVPNRKRIALLTDVFPLFINGVEMVVELLKRELEKLGYETYIVALWKKYTEFSLLPDDHYIPVVADFAAMIKGHKELMLLKTLHYKSDAKMLAMFGFDYLHLHTEYSMSQVAIELSRITGIKMPYTYHTLWKMYYENKFGNLMGDITYSAAKATLFNKVYRECPVIIVPSQKSFDVLHSEGNTKDVRIFPSPINQQRFTLDKEDKEKIAKLRAQYQLKGKKVIGYVGRVSTEKNITETIYNVSRVVSEIPNIVFMIVGVGDAISQLQKYAKKLNIEKHIIFVGQVPNNEIKCYYHLFDAFVTASNFETQGLTYFEAAQMGTLIIAKKDKAIEGIFEDGVNAYIYEDIYEWAQRIEKALFGDNKDVIDAAKQVVKKYSQDKWAKQMVKIYTELNPNK